MRDECFRKNSDYLSKHLLGLSFVNSNTWHLIYNNFNLNFIYGIVCLYVCVCAFSLHWESTDMILRDKPLISEVVLSHPLHEIQLNFTTEQLSLWVSEVDGSVWLLDQLQLHESVTCTSCKELLRLHVLQGGAVLLQLQKFHRNQLYLLSGNPSSPICYQHSHSSPQFSYLPGSAPCVTNHFNGKTRGKRISISM
jgi:hypothetical protein